MASRRDQTATSQTHHNTMESIATLCSCNQKCEVIEFCKDHQELVCSACASVKHRTCNISTIEEMSRNVAVVQTFNSTCEKVGDLANKAFEIKSHQASCLNGLQETEARCKMEIRNFKTDMINWIEKLEKNTLAELQSKIENLNEILQISGNSAENALTLLKVDQKLIENAQKSQSKRQMFIINIQIEKSVQHYEAALSEAESKLNIPNIQFEKNTKLSVILQESDYLGEMMTRESECKIEKEKETFLDLPASKVTSAGAKHADDKNLPRITGIAILNNGDILTADFFNSRLLLFDPTFEVKESIKCIEKPWDIAVMNDREVAVTLPGKQLLQYYIVSPKLQAGRNIKLDYGAYCWGVAVTKDCIYVSRDTPGKVQTTST